MNLFVYLFLAYLISVTTKHREIPENYNKVICLQPALTSFFIYLVLNKNFINFYLLI